ncbi:uncharacterized protein PHACADRAFT_212169 [Phanerochaete carnosa HHB-10118-sp]|nr:uncharacterized protein PHACADRAFT_212169 [Phanerochaete carnosa HHB-10118-sp]EKM51522.1 hypothetical protein PHACADRAFT_212169 [Phanerochaete carnosa HHB-10118-sp]
MVLQSKDLGIDTEEVEEVLLETEWSSEDVTTIQAKAEQCTLVLAAPADEA